VCGTGTLNLDVRWAAVCAAHLDHWLVIEALEAHTERIGAVCVRPSRGTRELPRRRGRVAPLPGSDAAMQLIIRDGLPFVTVTIVHRASHNETRRVRA